ncbi:MAG TPA: hypothetical protein VMZ27_10125 [Candidatus Saccharimonadales bacterium]|nr:hypothetical protein [Candidatus Saccharimonadales bacterium]
MKNLRNPNDALLQSLVEDAAHLAGLAAVEVRRRRRDSANALRVLIALLILLPPSIYLSKVYFHDKAVKADVRAGKSTNERPALSSVAYVKVQPADALGQAMPMLQGATKREKELLTEFPDVPLLIVKNRAGEVTTLHVFER